MTARAAFVYGMELDRYDQVAVRLLARLGKLDADLLDDAGDEATVTARRAEIFAQWLREEFPPASAALR